jgi:hypothetical protein
MRITTFAGNCFARNLGNGWDYLPGRPWEWTGTEIVAVVRRDAEQQAYLIYDTQRDAFAAWVASAFTDADGVADATVRYESTDDW